MWRHRRWVGNAVEVAVLTVTGAVMTGCAGHPLNWAPDSALAGQGQGPLAGVSWSVIEDPGQLIERQAPMAIGQHPLAEQQIKPSPEWLDLHGGQSRAVNRPPDLLRYEF